MSTQTQLKISKKPKPRFKFKGQTNLYQGKVRDVYTIKDEYLIMDVRDRISAFDVILPKPIPYKGQILNEIAIAAMKETQGICRNWLIDSPAPNVSIGKKCEPFKFEVIVRNYLAGSAWRAYKSGVREICGVALPKGLKENSKLGKPIITPTTKAVVGHDEDLSYEQILTLGLATKEQLDTIYDYAIRIFEKGTEFAKERGLILVDTKYEFGYIKNGEVLLIDEIHTPDSSRYFYANSYQENFSKGLSQKHLSKEFVREWLMENGFEGKVGQKIPRMTESIVQGILNRYIELYEVFMRRPFVRSDLSNKEVKEHCVRTLKMLERNPI